MSLDRTDAPATGEYATIYVAFELSKAKWKLGVIVPGKEKMSEYTIAGGDLAALQALLLKARKKAERSGKPVQILSCYEAGYDAHWLHRWLTDRGVTNYEIDPSSIEVNRRARRAKTDRIDLAKLMRTFLSYLRGEPRACSMVRVPSVEDEDRKRLTRERDRLVKERGAHTSRIKSLLHAQGIRDATPMRRGFLASLATLCTGDGRRLPVKLKQEIVREHQRLCLVNQQIAELEATSKAELGAATPGSAEAKIVQLINLRSIGPTLGQKLVHEVFYRSFDNRRQVGSCVGLVGSPYCSGTIQRDQGISKAGNARARAAAIELAWLWLRHQPGSALAAWFRERVGKVNDQHEKRRLKRITIVAVARKLMVALWRYLTTGVVPAGAELRTA